MVAAGFLARKSGRGFFSYQGNAMFGAWMMRYAFLKAGASRSFPEGDAFLRGQCDVDGAEVIIYSGAQFKSHPRKAVILIELHDECLGEHVDDRDPTCS
jgi:hypothetical protein